MRIIYFHDTDSLIMDFEADYEKAVGRVDTHAIGDELVVTADEAGNLYQIEVMNHAAKRMNLEEVTAEGFRPKFRLEVPHPGFDSACYLIGVINLDAVSRQVPGRQPLACETASEISLAVLSVKQTVLKVFLQLILSMEESRRVRGESYSVVLSETRS